MMSFMSQCKSEKFIDQTVFLRTGVAPEGGGGARAPPSGNLSPHVGEKLTTRREIFTDKHTYILHKL